MKPIKYAFLSGLAAFALSGSLTSCSSDDEFDSTETIYTSEASYSYDKDGVWVDNAQPGFLNIDDYEFSHLVIDGYVYGFTPSNATDTSIHESLYEYPYIASAGGGLSGAGSQYLVGYWPSFLEENLEGTQFDQRHCRIYEEDGDRFQPQSVMVCTNTYLEQAALNGTDFSPVFEPGDWVTLTAHGVHQDGLTGEATFYLINIESNDIKAGIQTSWKEFDLTALGTCTGVYFTMNCSERLKGEWGINIPTYFCLDKLVVKE